MLRQAYAEFLASRATGSRTGCVSPESIDALASAQGDSAARLQVLDHVMGCGDCRREFDQLRTLFRASRAERSVRRVRWQVAATVLLALGATLVWRWRAGSAQPELRGTERLDLLAPVGQIPISSLPPFVWHAVRGAVSYRFELLEGDRLRYALTQADTAVTLPDSIHLAPGKSYGWWVVAEIPGERAATSRVLRFTLHSQ